MLAAVREHEDAQESDREATELVKTDIGATTDELVAGLVGTSTIVQDESFGVSIDRWRLFATEAANTTVIVNLALEFKVSDADRSQFEALIGQLDRRAGARWESCHRRTPTDLPARGRRRFGGRCRRLPRLIGFDIASESVRGDAANTARDENTIVISEPVAAQSSGVPSFFVVKPLYRLGALLNDR